MKDNPIILTAVVLGIVQAFKTAGLPSKFSPIIAIITGVLLMFGFEGITANSAITGIVVGLSAVGLYSSGSQVGETINKK